MGEELFREAQVLCSNVGVRLIRVDKGAELVECTGPRGGRVWSPLGRGKMVSGDKWNGRRYFSTLRDVLVCMVERSEESSDVDRVEAYIEWAEGDYMVVVRHGDFDPEVFRSLSHYFYNSASSYIRLQHPPSAPGACSVFSSSTLTFINALQTWWRFLSVEKSW